ncbi:MAG: histidine triad nucleotide-binding protein [Phototrophicales bacterium]|nr:MAG: histidine triad nucleotide-binding protein [Phototrophicales bacterium]
MSEPSVFTRILNGEIPGEFVYKDDLVFAIRDINPIAPTHILIIPREPLVSVNDLDEAKEHIAGRMLVVAAKLAKEMGIDSSGYRLVINTGPDGGQEVMHLHMHLLGGRKMRGLG